MIEVDQLPASRTKTTVQRKHIGSTFIASVPVFKGTLSSLTELFTRLAVYVLLGPLVCSKCVFTLAN